MHQTLIRALKSRTAMLMSFLVLIFMISDEYLHHKLSFEGAVRIAVMVLVVSIFAFHNGKLRSDAAVGNMPKRP